MKKRKKANDESFRLARTLRTRLRKALLSQEAKKNSKTEKVFGISL